MKHHEVLNIVSAAATELEILSERAITLASDLSQENYTIEDPYYYLYNQKTARVKNDIITDCLIRMDKQIEIIYATIGHQSILKENKRNG